MTLRIADLEARFGDILGPGRGSGRPGEPTRNPFAELLAPSILKRVLGVDFELSYAELRAEIGAQAARVVAETLLLPSMAGMDVIPEASSYSGAPMTCRLLDAGRLRKQMAVKFDAFQRP